MYFILLFRWNMTAYHRSQRLTFGKTGKVNNFPVSDFCESRRQGHITTKTDLIKRKQDIGRISLWILSPAQCTLSMNLTLQSQIKADDAIQNLFYAITNFVTYAWGKVTFALWLQYKVLHYCSSWNNRHKDEIELC